MKKTALEIYALAVCFGAIAVLAIYAGMSAWNIIGLKWPELTVSGYEYESHLTDEAFAERRNRFQKDTPPLSPEEAKLKRIESYATVLKVERHDHLQGLVEGALGVMIAAFVFIIHWHLAKRVRGSGVA